MPTQIISVALPTPLRKHFDYSVSDTQAISLQPGCRVRVNFGHRDMIGIAITQAHLSDNIEQSYKPILEQLDDNPIFTPDLWALCKWAATYYQHPLGEVLFGAIPTALRKGLPPKASTEQYWQLSDHGKGLPDNALKRAKKQQLCLQTLQTHGATSAKQLAELGISRSVINALNDKHLIEAIDTRLAPTPITPTQTIALNTEQQHAYEALRHSSNQNKPSLLFGVTGSGKTEVYLARMSDAICAGEQVLVLVPEINLTPQFVRRFEQRLGLTVEAMHSGMTDKQRLDIWVRAKEGSLAVVIGTRSALFTPFAKLGLIIVDEEHANTLKQHEGFRYSARDCAIWRAQYLKAPLILGSATPSLESYKNAQSGRYHLLQLTQRAQNATQPHWEIADIRGQAVQAGVSESSLVKIAGAIARKEQVLVFVNRLGYAPNLQCHDCGWHAQCALCDTNQTLFLQRQTLRCQHCNTNIRLPKHCPECSQTNLQTSGQGTEQVSAYLARYFDVTPVLRMDSETTQSRQKLKDLLQQINTGEPCIIVGTQLMAKGHDFAKLSLVVIVNADDGLISANYRAIERTAQLLTQVGGRAGRSDKQGTVLVQTHYPEQPLFTLLANNHYQTIINEELAAREQLALPPYSYEAQILTASQQHYASEQCLTELVSSHQWTCNIIGPMPATLARKAGQFRSVLLFRSTQRSTLHHNISHAVNWLDQHAKKHKCRWSVDVDPIEHQ